MPFALKMEVQIITLQKDLKDLQISKINKINHKLKVFKLKIVVINLNNHKTPK